MSIYKELLDEGEFDEMEIRNAILEENDAVIGELADEGEFSPDEVLTALSQEAGMPDVIGGFEDTKTEEQETQLKFFNNITKRDGTVIVDNNGSLVESPDNKTTSTANQMIESAENYKVNNAMAKSYVGGMKKLPIGAKIIMADMFQWIESKVDSEDADSEDYAKAARLWARRNQQEIDKYNEIAGFEKDDIFTPDLFGEITSEGLTATLGVFAKLPKLLKIGKLRGATQGALAEGALATTTAVGGGKDYGDALVSGAASAVGAKVGGELLVGLGKFIDDPAIIKNIISGKASDKQTLDYLVAASGETDQSINQFYAIYAEAVGKSVNELNPTDKMQAIVKNSGAGSKFKTESEYYGDGVLAKTNYFEQQVKQLFEKNLEGADIPADKLNEFLSGASKNYKEIKDAIIENFDTDIYVSKNGLSSVIKSVKNASNNQNQATVDKVLNQLTDGIENPLGIEELLNLKKDLNSLNLSGVKGFKAEEVKGYVDKMVDNHFMKGGQEEGELATKLWKQANIRYAQKKAIEDGDNWVTDLIQKKGSKKISTDDFANGVMSQTERGSANFNQLKDFIGEDATAQVEKKIIQNIFEKKEGLSSSLEYIKGFDFVTTEGKQLRSELIRLEGVIPKESSIKLLQKFIGSKDVGSVGFSDNLISKFKFSIIGRTYNAIITRMPSATPERAFRTLGDKLKKGIDDIKVNVTEDPTLQKAFEKELVLLRTDIDRLKEMGASRTSTQNRQLAEVTYAAQQMQKQIEHKKPSIRGKDKQEDGIRLKDNSLPDKNVARPTTRQERMNIVETTRKKKDTIEGEIVEDTNKLLGKPKDEVIDTTVVGGGNKKLTEAQAKRSNKVIDEINDNLESIKRLHFETKQIPKSGLSKAKKKARADDIASKIREIKASNVTLRKSIPKI